MSEYDNDWEDKLESHEKSKEKDVPKGEEIRSEDLEDDWEPREETEDPFTEYENWEPGDEPEDLFENQKFEQYSKDDNTKQLNKEGNYETTKKISYNQTLQGTC